ncbi:hypothetical protein L798_12564 [Zootermopsis nevadensis]|uniref:Uncharacterized protein n=1 Tax=Zootermopsis nevadensis TaxID=136037 RepID=A0A067R314_ZOONE|nr:hypothetical protein L798_12564 [Zootermopsis nevadensis]
MSSCCGDSDLASDSFADIIRAISSSAEESNGHAPLDYLDCRSSC